MKSGSSWVRIPVTFKAVTEKRVKEKFSRSQQGIKFLLTDFQDCKILCRSFSPHGTQILVLLQFSFFSFHWRPELASNFFSSLEKLNQAWDGSTRWLDGKVNTKLALHRLSLSLSLQISLSYLWLDPRCLKDHCLHSELILQSHSLPFLSCSSEDVCNKLCV